MRGVVWAVLAVLGLALMSLSYSKLVRGDSRAPWASGILFVREGEGDAAKPINEHMVVPATLRLLPVRPESAALLKGLSAASGGKTAAVEVRVRTKLIELSVTDMEPLASWLSEGRMPEAGRDEVIAGAETPAADHLSVQGKTLNVVGRLQSSVALLAGSYMVPAHPEIASLFVKDDADVREAKLVRLDAAALRDRKQLAQIIEAFPSPSFTMIMPHVRPERPAFLAYLAAQALFLVSGTGLLIGLYRYLAGRIAWPLLAAPLQEIVRRPRLIWAVHLVYFGLFVVGALIIYELPSVHMVMMSGVQGQIADKGNGVLAMAGRAYGSGNMIHAALVTFLINFFLGSLAMITLPSFIVPGCGGLLAMIRATIWGVLLGPSEKSLAWLMLPHTGTLLLEGGGYILAAFFAILIPVYFFSSSQPIAKQLIADELPSAESVDFPPRQTAGQRFRAALALNLKGNLLVALVLVAAAIFEAVEVIMMAGF